MADVFSREQRSRIMSRIHGVDTKPELEVRKRLFSMGFRYRIHYSGLPGKPDIVLPKHKKVIFINGCFWHGHQNCQRSKLPTSNAAFWQTKIGRTIERDHRNIEMLLRLGWQVLTIWSCETKNGELLEQKLKDFLDDRTAQAN